MNEFELVHFKSRLFSACKLQLEKRIAQCAEQMRNAQEAANSEEKSSAGDKYETSRAMNQLNKDMYARQLQENQHELSIFLSLEQVSQKDIGQAGSLINCGDVLFYISVGLGKIEFEGKTVVVVSAMAPLSQQLLGRKKGDTIVFNKASLHILSMC